MVWINGYWCFSQLSHSLTHSLAHSLTAKRVPRRCERAKLRRTGRKKERAQTAVNTTASHLWLSKSLMISNENESRNLLIQGYLVHSCHLLLFQPYTLHSLQFIGLAAAKNISLWFLWWKMSLVILSLMPGWFVYTLWKWLTYNSVGQYSISELNVMSFSCGKKHMTKWRQALADWSVQYL